jgi:hypothetical protein
MDFDKKSDGTIIIEFDVEDEAEQQLANEILDKIER